MDMDKAKAWAKANPKKAVFVVFVAIAIFVGTSGVV